MVWSMLSMGSASTQELKKAMLNHVALGIWMHSCHLARFSSGILRRVPHAYSVVVLRRMEFPGCYGNAFPGRKACISKEVLTPFFCLSVGKMTKIVQACLWDRLAPPPPPRHPGSALVNVSRCKTGAPLSRGGFSQHVSFKDEEQR